MCVTGVLLVLGWLCRLGRLEASDALLVSVPRDASPGHILGVLSTDRHTQSHLASSEEAHPHIALSRDGVLTVKSDVSHLAADTLTIQHQCEDREWKQQIHLQFLHVVPKSQFTQVEYTGRISENQPIGTNLRDLSEFYTSAEEFPEECVLTIVRGDFDAFKIGRTPNGNVYIVSGSVFDREAQNLYSFVVKAECFGGLEAFTRVVVMVTDVNDNAPQFGMDFYAVILQTEDLVENRQILQVEAFDEDDNDEIRYSLSASGVLQIDPQLGQIHLTHPELLTDGSFQVLAYAHDRAGNSGEPATVHVTVDNSPMEILDEWDMLNEHTIQKRDLRRDGRSFVVRDNIYGDLFSVAPIPPIEGERYYFVDPAPENLTLDSVTGMVSRENNHIWNSSMETFMVNITFGEETDDMEVAVYTESVMNWEAPILTNEPFPLKARVPIWIRPYTTIFTAQARIVEQYGVEVHYKIESGGEGRFYIEPMTGEVKIRDRGEFEEGYLYYLAISAQTVGNARRTDTPAQLLTVQVEDVPPQFYLNPYVLNFSENSTQGQVIGTINAKSFQELTQTYSVLFDDPSDASMFTVNVDTGQVTLQTDFVYIQENRFQFRGLVNAIEGVSSISNSVELIINLVPVNLHTPFFPAAHYVRTGISEDVSIGSPILDVLAVDLDPDDLGYLDFTVNDPRFQIVSSDGKTGVLETTADLDYDTAGPEHKYEFTIVATDRDLVSPKSGTATVQVYLVNVEDEAPVFYPPEQVVFVTEFTPAAVEFVYFVQAYDPDHPVNGQLSFSFDNVGDCTSSTVTSCDIFTLDQTTGMLTLNQDVPAAKENLVLPLLVDDGTFSTSGNVTINFVGVNNPPAFPECSQYLYSAAIEEGQGPNTHIINITAVDNDAGVNGQLRLSLVEDFRYDEYFGLNQLSNNMAELYNIVEFDREDPENGVVIVDGEIRYRVTILAEDEGNPTLSTTCFFFVTIGDVNDNPPRFDDQFYEVYTSNPPAETEFLRVFAVDDDNGTNAVVVYSIVSQPNSCNGGPCFTIDSNSGWLSLQTTVPNGVTRIQFTVKAEDQGSVPLHQNVTVTVEFVDLANQLPPIWRDIGGQRIDDVTGLCLLENVSTNTRVDVFLKADLEGENIPRTYFIERGRTDQENGALDFFGQQNAMNQSLDLFVVSSLKYERVSEYSLKLRVSRAQTGAPYTDARLRVCVEDVNDYVPEFQGLDRTGRYPAAVSDRTEVNDLVLTVIAIDLDGVAPNNNVTYHWADDCVGGDCDAFTLDSDTGEIRANQEYDRNPRSFLLGVVAEDGAPSAILNNGQPNRAETDVTVLVLGPSTGSPGFTEGRYQFPFIEGQPLLTPIATVTAFDPDEEFNYPQYMISEGNEQHLFAVDTTNGTIYNTGYLMYQQQESYVFAYSVFDGRTINKTQVVVNVTSANIYPPVFAQDEYENSAHTEETDLPEDLLLASAVANDPDNTRPNDIQYSIEGPLTQGNDFTINNTGHVFLQAPGNLDRDYPDGYSNWQFNLVAEDEGPDSNKGYAVMNVLLQDINDNAPIFQPCCFEGSVAEHSPTGTTVMTLLATDVDAGDNGVVTYELLYSPQDLFDVSPDGVVTTTTDTLDREDQDKYEIVVQARDNGVPPIYSADNQTIYITVTDVNDHAPVFVDAPYALSMPEELPLGGSVVDIPADDLDIGDNAKLTFQIDSGGDDKFYFDNIYVGKSGVLKIAERVDYDTLPDKTFTLQISVSDPDNTGTNSPTSLEITVLDINDNAPLVAPPQFSTAFDEDEPIGHSVATFTATDPDTGPGGVFSFSIDYENTDPEKKFAIDPISGEVTTRNLVDREEQEDYRVHILATDQGDPPMTGTGTLLVTLNDINDHAPDFDPNLPPVIVGANTGLGDEVLRFTGFDLDTPENGPPFTFEYDCNSVECEDFTFSFEPDENNGTGILRANEDGYNRYVQNRKQYALGVKMTDNPASGQPPMSATRTLTVTIESLNDREMEEAGSTKDAIVYNYEQSFDMVDCGQVYVNDPDDWDLPDKSFNCVGGCEEEVEGTLYEYFIVSTDSGQVTKRAGTPRGMHTLSIEVYDRKWDQTITATMNINVIYIYGDAVLSSGSMRLEGTSSTDLIRRSDSASKLELFKTKLASLLGVDEANVEIFSVIDEAGEEGMVDVQFAAHGSPYYSSARMNGLVLANKAEIESEVGISIYSSPVDLCFLETCFSGGCDNRVLTLTEPALVNTNTTSYVGVNTTYEFACECKAQMYTDDPPTCEAYSCYNGGQCVETWNGFRCNCLPGFNGQRCQSTHVSFDGNSWAWFESLGARQCADSRLSVQFMTAEASGLLLYNGPMGDPSQQLNVTDFLAIWLDTGFVHARVNLGDGEVEMSVTDANGADPVNDGAWHTVEFIREQTTLRLIVDHCLDSTIDENVNETDEDRGRCESRVEYPGEMFLLNVLSPLELGGRSNPNYPPNLPTAGFNGCIKGLMHGDYLYDLTLNRTQTSGAPSNVCSRELGCAAPAACPVNSTCIGNFNNADKQCVCDSGWRGTNCDTETPVKDIETDEGFIEWELKPDFNNTDLSPRAVSIQLEYRSRQPDGILFTASSFSRLEHLKLDLIDTHLRLRYDLGSDERDLWLSYVNASDGLWHVVTITRYGNQVILKMDHGEGKYYNESLPQDEHHQLMFMHDTRQTFGGAEVYYRKYVTQPVVTDVLISSCVKDIRVDNVWFPMAPGDDQSEAAIVVQDPNTIDNCESTACDGVTCPAGQFCEDRWRMPYCVCPFGEEFVGGACVPVTDCSVPRCNFGYCVVSEGLWRCVCDDGWTGIDCNEPAAVGGMSYQVSITEGAIAAIVISLLILLLLILIVIFCVLRKTQKDPLLVDPEDDTRENIVYYDEEGAGEEDMHAYDLSRLQKPDGPPEMMMVASKPPPAVPYREIQPLSSAAPEPMHDPRAPFLPHDHPNVGNFIVTRVDDADNDPNAPPYDSVREYEYEGNGSSAGSLSSIQTSSSGDLDFDYLNDYGPNFNKLADIYGAGEPGVDD